MLKYGPYSPSRLDVAYCPYRFFNSYIEKRNEAKVESLPQARGSAVHEVFEKITAKHKEKLPLSPSEVQAWVEESIKKHPAAYAETGEIYRMCALYAQHPPKGLTSDAGVELRLAVKHDGQKFVECDYEDPTAFARGRADILIISDDTTKCTVIDHKTQPNTEDADTFQMKFYAWVICKIYPFLNEVSTILHFARYGTYSTECIHSREYLENFFEPADLLARVNTIEATENWCAIPNKHCQYCPFIGECPVLGQVLSKDDNGRFCIDKEMLVCRTTNDAVRLAGLINILDDLNGRAKELLKEHVKMSGPIAISGNKIWDFWPKSGANWDHVNRKLRDQVYKVIESHGIDPKDLMVFSTKSTKALMYHENQKLIEDLKAIVPYTTKTTFKGSTGSKMEDDD